MDNYTMATAEARKNTPTGSQYEDEKLCPATLSDYEAVMNIDRDVFYGTDYLPAQYGELIQKPGSWAYIYKKEDRVVGFMIASLVDGGQTLMISAGRIAPDCRGGGMYGRFNRRVLELFRESHGLKHVVMTTNNHNMQLNGHKILKTYRIVEEQDIASYEMDVVEAKKKVPRNLPEFAGLRQLTREDIHDMLSRDPSDLKNLFPAERIIVAWKPYRVMAANTDYVFEDSARHLLLAYYGRSKDPKSTHFPGTLLSFGNFFTCKYGLRQEIFLYGSGTNEQVRAHLERHFLLLIQNCELEKAIMQIHYSRLLNDECAPLKEVYCLKEMDYWPKKTVVLEAPYTDVLKLSH